METDELKKVLKIMRFKNNQIKYILCYINSPINIQELYQKINLLKELNVKNRIIRLAIEENPKFLMADLNEIKKIVNYIKSKIPEKEIKKIIECTPQILTMSLEQLIKNEKILAEFVSEDRIREIYIYRSGILKLDNDYLNYKINLIIKNGFEKNIFKIIMMYPEYFLNFNNDMDYLKKYILLLC